MLLATAVLTRRCDLKPLDQDVFVNVVGGLKVDEPAADLAMSMAIASSYCNTSFPADMVMIGEVGLSGELCSVSQTNLRLDEVPPLPDLIRQQVLALNLVKSWALDSAPFY
jgi:DNA repair protein RadA/Sms